MEAGVLDRRGVLRNPEKRDTFLVINSQVGANEKVEFERYQPTAENPALFREFAEMDASAENIVSFADRWGPLNTTFELVRPINDDISSSIQSDISRNSSFDGQQLSVWQDHQNQLREIVRIWDSVQEKKSNELECDFRWDEQNKCFMRFSNRRFREGWYNYARLSQLPDGTKPGDIVAAARHWVIQHINQSLARSASPALVSQSDKEMFSLHIVVKNLIGFFWLQLSQSIGDGARFNRCSVCAKPMKISPGEGRPDRSYCSDACRMRAYRKRKSEKHLRKQNNDR